MTALAAADFTVTVDAGFPRRAGSKQRKVQGTIAFGDGSKTYSTGGIPFPTYDKFGFQRNLDEIHIWGLNGLTSDWMLRYDKTNVKLQLFDQTPTSATAQLALTEAATSEAPAARTYRFTAYGW